MIARGKADNTAQWGAESADAFEIDGYDNKFYHRYLYPRSRV
jgi:hypothetical protein